MAQAAPAASGVSEGSPLLPASISSHARLMLPLPSQQVSCDHGTLKTKSAYLLALSPHVAAFL